MRLLWNESSLNNSQTVSMHEAPLIKQSSVPFKTGDTYINQFYMGLITEMCKDYRWTLETHWEALTMFWTTQ